METTFGGDFPTEEDGLAEAFRDFREGYGTYLGGLQLAHSALRCAAVRCAALVIDGLERWQIDRLILYKAVAATPNKSKQTSII